jgi:hypothetical protein
MGITARVQATGETSFLSSRQERDAKDWTFTPVKSLGLLGNSVPAQFQEKGLSFPAVQLCGLTRGTTLGYL